MPHTSSTLAGLRPCTPGYRLHCSDTNFQLYNKHVRDTFVFINRPPRQSTSEIATSIALQKISTTVQRVRIDSTSYVHALTYTNQQIGRINKTAVTAIELHVVSNRDRVAHQLFDLWFEQCVNSCVKVILRLLTYYITPVYQRKNTSNVSNVMQHLINSMI